LTNITQTHLEAALIDQSAAGAFHDKTYCFVSVGAEGGGWQLGVAVANEPGYHPIAKFFRTHDEAEEWATGLNRHIGRSVGEAFEIIGSTMGGRRVFEVSR
jgi:hypothetical protein